MSPSKPSRADAGRPAKRRASARHDPPRRRGGRQPQALLEVFGGRLWTVVLLLGLMAAVPSPILPFQNMLRGIGESFEPQPADPSSWQPGSTSTLKLSVVTSDFKSLQCASQLEFEGKHCEYQTETEQWPPKLNEPVDDNGRKLLQPYRTWLGNHLVLLSGLWSHPEIAQRLHREPPPTKPGVKLARFVVECEVDFLGTMQQPTLRWQRAAKWQTDSSTVAVGRTKSCRILPDAGD